MKTVNDVKRVVALLAPLVLAATSASCNRGASPGGVEQRGSAVVTTLPQFVVYGERSVKLGNNTHVNGGDVGVRARAAACFGAQLKLAQTVLVDTHRTLFAPSVSLDAHSVVGNIDTDALTNTGATRGAIAAFPAADMPPGPLSGGATPGTTNVTVASGANRTLDPGSYGALSDGGTIFLKPGAYSFTSVTLADRAQLVANGPGTSSVFVAGQFLAGSHITLSALSGGAGALSIFVAGNDGAKSAVTLGSYASIVALVATPHGTLSLGDHTDATGAYAGFDVIVGEAVVLTYQKGFAPPPANPPQQLSGYLTPAIASAPLVGPVPQSTVVDLAIGLALPDRPGLVQKFHDVSDPTSASYRHYLTPAQLTAAYSPTQISFTALTSWATAAGLTVTEAPANRLLLNVRGTAGQIGQALSSSLVLRARPDGTSFYALDREPAVTLAPTAPIFRISGLDNLVVPTPGPVTGGAPSPGGGTGPGQNYVSRDFRQAYASCTTNTGNTEKVGLFELDGFLQTDVKAYGCNSGLLTCDALGTVLAGALPPVSTVLVDGYSGVALAVDGQQECTVDVQLAMAMAPGLASVVVYEAPRDGNVARHNHILNKMAADTTVRQFSSSWFFGVDGNTQTILYTLALQGQSFMQCSGDRGSSSWSGDPGDIRDLEAVTVVGATSLTLTPFFLYGSETTWNVAGGGASGGGVASNTTSPLYQAPFSSALGQGGKRVLPDLALVGAQEHGVVNAKNLQFSGTSLAAPLFAAWVALSNEAGAAQGIGPAGFVNNFLYSVGGAAPSIYAASFNDIADNSNNAGSCPSGVGSGFCPNNKWATNPMSTSYVAGAGYDMATGLGSPTCYLMNELSTSMIQAPPVDGGAGGAGGGGGAGGAGGADGGAGTPSLAVVATASGRGVELCMQGGGFDEGHQVQFAFLNLPAGKPMQTEIEAPLIVSAGGSYTNFDSTFGGGASSQQGFIQNCTADDLTRSMTIQVTQLDNPAKVATASISNTWVCGREPAQNSFNETPLPFPPMFGQTTCPLPP